MPRSSTPVGGPIPARAGIGLRPPHNRQLLSEHPEIGWLEAHSENYFGAGGAPLLYLEQLRECYPLSLHGVGLSLGSTDPLSQAHLDRLRALINRVQPALVSEHLSWSSVGGIYFNDLLPLPYTEEALGHFSDRVSATQEQLGRTILIENPSSYLRFEHSTIPEPEFLIEVARRSGCSLLLDVNNVYVSAVNHGFSATDYLEAIPVHLVAEMHLAGHSARQLDGRWILIDDHGSRVSEPVWDLYRRALQRFPGVPTLIEWDSEIPALSVLLQEAEQAERLRGELSDAVAA